MTLKSLAFVIVAFASTGAAFAAPSYTASLASPAAVGRVVSSDRLWSCEGATCVAGGEASSPAKHICVRIARDVGALTAFSAGGRTFTPDEVAVCNSRAGHGVVTAAK